MSTEPPSPSVQTSDTSHPPSDTQPLKPGTYAWIAGGGLLVSIALLLFMVFQADLIVASGLDHRVFYVLLIPLGLASAAFAYGAMASTGGFSGRLGPGEVKLTGPAVFAGLVVVGGFFLVPEGGAVTLVVRVHEGESAGPPVASAQVVLDAGQARATSATDPGGQVVFAGLDRSAVAGGFTVGVSAAGYEPARLSITTPPVDGVVEVSLSELPVILTGTVLERASREPAVGVALDFGSGSGADTTDAMGSFRVELSRKLGPRVMVLGLRGDTVLSTEVSLQSDTPHTLLFGN